MFKVLTQQKNVEVEVELRVIVSYNEVFILGYMTHTLPFNFLFLDFSRLRDFDGRGFY